MGGKLIMFVLNGFVTVGTESQFIYFTFLFLNFDNVHFRGILKDVITLKTMFSLGFQSLNV